MRMYPSTHLAFLTALLVLAIGCGDKIDPLAGPGGDVGTDVTYTGQIKQVLDTNCIRCHSSDRQGAERNGAPPSVNLDTYEGAVDASARALVRIQAGTMPPDTGGIPQGDRDLFQAWVDQGLKE